MAFEKDTAGTLETSLVSYWKLDETSGTRYDEYGPNDLTDNNTVSYLTGKKGNAADFESTNSEYLEISDASQTGLDQAGDMSIAMWVKFETTPSSDSFDLVGKYNGSTDNIAYRFNLLASGPTLQYRNKDTADGNPANTKTVGVSWSPSTATWYHIAVVYDASAGSAAFYVDGSQQGTTQTGLNTSQTNTAAAFNIGRRGEGSGYFDGLIDEVGFWSKTLSSTEISDLYNSGSGNTYSTSTAYTTTLTEAVLLADALPLKTKKLLSEALTLADTLVRQGKKVLSDVVTFADSISSRFIFTKVLSETIAIADSAIRKTRKALTEVITLAETFQKKSFWEFVETVTVADSLSNKTKLVLAEAVSVADSLVRKGKKQFSETMALADTFGRTWLKVLSETVAVADTLLRKTKKILTEGISLRDRLSKFLTWLGVTRSSDATYSDVSRSDDDEWDPVIRN